MIICTIFSSIDGALCLEIGVKRTIERNKYIMKFSDLMLDMATGDASIHDAYIQEAVGKINVSHAYFEAAYKISELPQSDNEFMIVQEAADAGMPTDAEGATGVANEAVVQELNAFFDLVVATARKVKQAADKDFKALVGLGKGMGVSVGDTDNIRTFADNLAKAVVEGRGKNAKSSVMRVHPGSIELGSRKFLASMYMKKLTKKYAQGMGKFMAMYGLSIADAFKNESIKAYAGAEPVGAKEGSGIHGLSSALNSGIGQIIDKGNTADHGNKYRTNIAAKDIADLVMCVYTVRIISEAVIQVAGPKSVKKSVSANITQAMSGGSGKKSVSAVAHDIDEAVKNATPKMNDVAKNIVSGYTDSVYALVEVSNGGRAPLPKKADEKTDEES